MTEGIIGHDRFKGVDREDMNHLHPILHAILSMELYTDKFTSSRQHTDRNFRRNADPTSSPYAKEIRRSIPANGVSVVPQTTTLHYQKSPGSDFWTHCYHRLPFASSPHGVNIEGRKMSQPSQPLPFTTSRIPSHDTVQLTRTQSKHSKESKPRITVIGERRCPRCDVFP